MGALSMRTFVRAVVLKATADSITPAAVCKAIVSGNFESSVINGRTVIETAEAGGATKFLLPAGLTPGEVMNMASRALDYIESQPNPAAPALPTEIKRLRPCFSRVTL